MTTPIHLTYAGWLERIFANLIDTLIMLLPNGMIALVMSNTDGQGEPAVNPATLLVLFLCNVAYYTAFTSGRWQATPGQRLLGIRIIRSDGHNLNQRDALERYLAFVLPSLPLYTSLLPDTIAPTLAGMLTLFWLAPILYTANRAGIHDRLTHTRVIVGRPT
jgi:uncharacterized RDD family membrane protein YckC